jgi:hypothetical protein
MNRLITLATTLFGLNTACVWAGPCSSDIAQIESALRRPGGDIGPTDPQGLGAQLHRQPTPGSVQRAENTAVADLDAALARARALDADGKPAECTEAVKAIKNLIGMQ